MRLENNKGLLICGGMLMAGLLISGCHHKNKKNSDQGAKRPERVIPAYYKNFQGTVGSEKVTLQLIKYSERYEGIFLDDSTGQPLSLAGSKDSSGQLVLVSYYRYNPVDTFVGKFPQPGVFQGTFSDTAGQHAPFTLQEIYPAGTIHWNVYTLSDSLSLDSAKHSSPMARVRLMLLWPKEKSLSAGQSSLLEDSLVKNYGSLDTVLRDPAKVLRVVEDTFLTQYKKFGESLRSSDYGTMAATFNWQFNVSMQLLWNAGNIVSLAFKNYQYTGGAHGLGNTTLKVFDLKQGKVLRLKDIFKPGYEHILQQVLEEHLRMAYDIPAGAPLNGEAGILFDKHLALTKNFYVTGKGVGFIYNPYEVAPYVVGEIELYVPFSEITDILKPGVYMPQTP
jgi:hypothetical protein